MTYCSHVRLLGLLYTMKARNFILRVHLWLGSGIWYSNTRLDAMYRARVEKTQ